jgi:DNA/RNA-binding domain of Phe-tRNA-synthetase-like protein
VTAEPVRHPVDPLVADELPGLALWSLEVPTRPGPTTPELRERLRVLSGRVAGAHAVALRRQPIPHAYRVFFRHTGVDPDARRTPIEQAMLDRMLHGGFVSSGRVADALLVALVETGVPVWALDAGALEGALHLRPATPADAAVPAGRLAVADARRAVAELFGPTAPDAAVSRATRRARLVGVAVAGVPALCVEEALELAAEGMAVG